MRALRVLLSRLMQSVGLGRHRGDLDAELESHIALHTDDNMRSGMSPEDARRAALLAFGSAQATREVLHEQNGAPFVGIVSSTVRQAFRSLVRHPGFSVVRSRSTSGSSMAWDGCSILRTCRAAPSRNPPRVEPSPACAEAGQGVRPAAVMGGESFTRAVTPPWSVRRGRCRNRALAGAPGADRWTCGSSFDQAADRVAQVMCAAVG